MGMMEQFGGGENEDFEMPQTAFAVEGKIRDLEMKFSDSDYENASLEEKHRILDSVENKFDSLDSGLENIFVNPREDKDYSNLKEMIENKKELLFKRRRAILH